ncbi:hypothetical protein [Streptomyces sp. WM6386]|uniref:hypothetical protein n=1 Tax=Streptomyces sp. WM6386 TaxID=1415558 RepID=UPI00131A909F|nr:hypothetical protein [Streptomyces sp. WM6386]
MNSRVLLPGITTPVRAEENNRLHASVYKAVPGRLRTDMLETATVDDALDLLRGLTATKLLAKAERLATEAKLKAQPQLQKAALQVAAAVDVLMATPPATETGEMVSVLDAWSTIGQVVPRKQLAAALATIAVAVPDGDGDDEAEWWTELVVRYGTGRSFTRLLVEVIDFGAVPAGVPVVEALKRLLELIGRKKAGAGEVAGELVTGSWRRLVFADPDIEAGLVDRAAYSFCVLEHLHRALRRRDGLGGGSAAAAGRAGWVLPKK